MPSDETRRLLKLFGVAVTEFEDAIVGQSAVDVRRAAEAEAVSKLQEVTALIERLRNAK